VIPFKIRLDLWHQKTRVPGLSCGIICVILRLAVLIQYRSVTDRQTHTHDVIYRASIASHGKMQCSQFLLNTSASQICTTAEKYEPG